MKSADLPSELPDDLSTLWQLTRRLGALMDKQSDAICRQELGISFAQFLVLSVVDAYPGNLSQQAVADRLGLTKGTVSRQLDAACAAGLMTVRPAPHTRRENVVELTAAGTRLVRKGDVVLASARSALSEAAESLDLSSTMKTLRSLLAVVENEAGPSASR